MSRGGYELGKSLQKQFKRTTMSGGPLQGARYLEVSWENKQYKSDPRFNQFAKRVLSERALGSDSNTTPITAPATARVTWFQWGKDLVKSYLAWFIAKTKMRFGLTILLAIVIMVVLSRPLFYAVLAKPVALSLRLLLRRPVGLLVLLVDTILDEAASSLEASLLTPPPPAGANMHHHHEMLAPSRGIHDFLVRGLFAIIGLLLGHRLPRAARPAHNGPPQRLRVV